MGEAGQHPKGNDLRGEDWEEWFGVTFSIFAYGSRLAVGAYGYEEYNEDTGRTLVFDFDGENWFFFRLPNHR